MTQTFNNLYLGARVIITGDHAWCGEEGIILECAHAPQPSRPAQFLIRLENGFRCLAGFGSFVLWDDHESIEP